ncbi:MAG: nucleoside triphosphate pyrophosphohydrolase [Gammaproteobacteria bacterium]|nr:nucleoside triphosphate pyrophosphohydrolase [Gammaproteobacteria bacterium]
MIALRDPDHGCPWDREQDFQSITPYTIEEAYEVADAIARGDMGDLRDELGDLLFQVVFHAHMGSEQGAFDFDDVVNAISDKLERRHPHVFGHVFSGEEIGSAEQQSRAWEAHKKAERAASERGQAHSVLDSVHGGRPALQRATELQRAAASQGFDWRDAASVLPKLREELDELETAMSRPDGHQDSVEELGDLLFTCVNLARHLNVDADEILRRANTKFDNRFRRMESRVQRQGGSLEDATPAQMDALWEAGKRAETE